MSETPCTAYFKMECEGLGIPTELRLRCEARAGHPGAHRSTLDGRSGRQGSVITVGQSIRIGWWDQGPRPNLRKIPNVDDERTRYAVFVGEAEIGQVWSKVVNEEHRNWRSGMHATYVDVIYWTHGMTLDLYATRAEAVESLLWAMGQSSRRG